MKVDILQKKNYESHNLDISEQTEFEGIIEGVESVPAVFYHSSKYKETEPIELGSLNNISIDENWITGDLEYNANGEIFADLGAIEHISAEIDPVTKKITGLGLLPVGVNPGELMSSNLLEFESRKIFIDIGFQKQKIEFEKEGENEMTLEEILLFLETASDEDKMSIVTKLKKVGFSQEFYSAAGAVYWEFEEKTSNKLIEFGKALEEGKNVGIIEEEKSDYEGKTPEEIFAMGQEAAKTAAIEAAETKATDDLIAGTVKEFEEKKIILPSQKIEFETVLKSLSNKKTIETIEFSEVNGEKVEKKSNKSPLMAAIEFMSKQNKTYNSLLGNVGAGIEPIEFNKKEEKTEVDKAVDEFNS